jgi:hypothetical protein
MFGAVFVPHILQKFFPVLGIIRRLLLRIHIHCLVLVPKSSQLPEIIKNMCYNEKKIGCWTDLSIIFGQLLVGNLHGEV